MITPDHFRRLATLLLVVGLGYLYFTVNNFVGSVYVTETEETSLLHAIFSGSYAGQFWVMAVVGLAVPCVMLALPWTRSIGGIVTASVLVNIGMWLMRFIIVVPTLSSPFLPPPGLKPPPLHYFPTLIEWSITASGFAAFILFYILFSKVFPIVSIWEITPAPASAHAGEAAA